MRRVLFGIALGTLVGSARPATPMQWYDYATLAGGSGNEIPLYWGEPNNPPGDYYEIRVSWLERPERKILWTFQQAEVEVVYEWQRHKRVKLPGNGHFSFEFRVCWNAQTVARLSGQPASEPACSDWSSSLDPKVARVYEQARAWWVYGYLEPPGKPVVIDSAPTGPARQ